MQQFRFNVFALIAWVAGIVTLTLANIAILNGSQKFGELSFVWCFVTVASLIAYWMKKESDESKED